MGKGIKQRLTEFYIAVSFCCIVLIPRPKTIKTM